MFLETSQTDFKSMLRLPTKACQHWPRDRCKGLLKISYVCFENIKLNTRVTCARLSFVFQIKLISPWSFCLKQSRSNFRQWHAKLFCIGYSLARLQSEPLLIHKIVINCQDLHLGLDHTTSKIPPDQNMEQKRNPMYPYAISGYSSHDCRAVSSRP